MTTATTVGVLLVAWACLARPATARDEQAAPTASALERRLADAMAAGRWADAVEDATALAGIVEEQHLEALYALARSHAMLGHADAALAALERVRQAGWFDVGRVRKDEAFATLRGDARFTAVVQAIWLKGYLWLLERPERDDYQQPDRVMGALAFRPGERVADIGAGSGYFARRVARAVGPTGHVLALDIRPEILAHLASTATQAGLANITTRVVEPTDPHLPDASVDTILMVDTLHYVKDRAAYARRLRAALADNGRVVVIDFVPRSAGERPWGPPPEQNMSRAEVDVAMAEAGLVPARGRRDDNHSAAGGEPGPYAIRADTSRATSSTCRLPWFRHIHEQARPLRPQIDNSRSPSGDSSELGSDPNSSGVQLTWRRAETAPAGSGHTDVFQAPWSGSTDGTSQAHRRAEAVVCDRTGIGV